MLTITAENELLTISCSVYQILTGIQPGKKHMVINEDKFLRALVALKQENAALKDLAEKNTNQYKRLELELRQSEQRYKDLFENSGTGIVIIDRDGIYLMANNVAIERFGLSLSEIVGRSMFDFLPEEMAQKFFKRNRALINSGGECEYEETFIVNGEKRTFLLIDKCLQDTDGKNFAIQNCSIDITERKRAEENLRKLSRAVEQSQVSIVITDKEAVIEYVNPKFLEITGYSKEEVIGKNPRILKSDNTEVDYKEMWNILKSEKEWIGIFHNKKKNGELYWESATISPVKNEAGEITNYVAVKEDITVKKELELSLQKALEKAEESNKLKSSLLANMSHELRTPMTGIMGFTEILKGEVKNPDHQNTLELIEISAKRLMNSLNSVLDFAQMQSSCNNFKMSRVKLNELIDISVEKFRGAAQVKKINLEKFNGDEEFFIHANDGMIKRLLSNLIDNAVKYTDKGTIHISLTREAESENNYAVIKIKDTGIGMSKKDQEIIFEEFRQASEGFNRSYEGLGLGLTLVKKIVSDLKGRIDIDSRVNEGTEFRISIPIIVTKTIKEEPKIPALIIEDRLPVTSHKTAVKKKILYVEDNLINVLVVKSYLSKMYEVDHAKNGIEGLNKVKELNYDLVLMDINLGQGMDGIELTRIIREIDEYKGTPIIAVTGYAMYEDRDKILNEGLTDYIAKPFDKSSLDKIIRKNLN